MGTLAWLVLILAGVALGVAVGRFWPLDSLRLKTVENERAAAAKELQSYREEVREHFQHTGELFDRITSDYHTLYEHLATGADRLCSPAHAKNLLQAEPERRKLAHELAQGSAASADDAAAASVAAKAEAPPSGPATAKDDASSMTAAAKSDSSKAATGSAASPGDNPADAKADAKADADIGRNARDNVAAIRPDLHAVESNAPESERAPRKNTPPAA